MTLAKDMPDHAVLVAIDVAKHRKQILIEAPGRVRRRRLTVLNARADHDLLVETLAAFEAPVVFTDWLSIAPPVGLASRPSSSRAAITSVLLMPRQRPRSRQS